MVHPLSAAWPSVPRLRIAGASILTIDHHKKPINNQANPSDDTRSVGSTGKAALVDAALGLYRERGRLGLLGGPVLPPYTQ